MIASAQQDHLIVEIGINLSDMVCSSHSSEVSKVASPQQNDKHTLVKG